MKAKILLTQDYEIGEYENISVLKDSVTDWEEISKEDLEFLQKNIYRVNVYPYKAILVLKDDNTLQERINQVKINIQEQLDGYKNLEKKNKLRREKNKKEKVIKEKELLEKLKKKYETGA